MMSPQGGVESTQPACTKTTPLTLTQMAADLPLDRSNHRKVGCEDPVVVGSLDATSSTSDAPFELPADATIDDLSSLLPDDYTPLATSEDTLPRPASPVPRSLPRRRRALVWLRHDLRLHDNLALHAALQHHDMSILPVYIIHQPVKKKCGPVRFQFLLECIDDLAMSFRQKGSDLLVLRGEAMEVMQTILPAWGITDLYYEEFVMPYATARDQQVNQIAESFGVTVTTVQGRTLFDSKAILRKNNGHVFTDFSKFVKAVQELPQPPMPMATPATLPALEAPTQELKDVLLSHCHSTPTVLSAEYLAGKGDTPFAIPALEEFGIPVPKVHSFLYGGETVALRLLDEYCAEEERVALFQKPRTSPACTDKQSTTTLSAHVAFGCVSLREFFYRVMFIQLKFSGQQGPPAVTLDGQLMWREFFYCFGVGAPGFDTQVENPMCMQINWKLQELPTTTDSSQWDDETKTSMDHLRAWREGRTGFPWIDAVIRQIEQEGWAHHVARHAVACFLTRGDLYISWLRGAYFFQEKLIDLDWPINIGNWLWVSSSCFYHDYNLIHSPSLYVQSWDPQGHFIRKYVPALEKMPARYIFEPWKAPLSVQRAAGCLIGKDYPFPIVDHPSAMKRCVQWLDNIHERVHSHDGVLMTCCDEHGNLRCPRDLRQQQQAEAQDGPTRKKHKLT